MDQTNYWNKVAYEKTFTHPLDISLLETFVSKDDCIVDYGCGYGRLIEQLKNAGYKNLYGYDTSIELVNRAHKNGIESVFHISSLTGLPIKDDSFDCIILFAVLTCIPDNETQMELMQFLHSKLKSGGIIYISDYYLQRNSIEVQKYACFNDDPKKFGVFTLPEGVSFRHHTKEWIEDLLKNLQLLNENLIEVKTMNGNTAEAFQIVARKK